MARLSSSQSQKPIQHDEIVAEAPSTQSTTDIGNKKKSRKSTSKAPSSPTQAMNGVEAVVQDGESRPSKRKRESEPGHMKAKKSKHQEEKSHVDDVAASFPGAQDDKYVNTQLPAEATPKESPTADREPPRTRSGKIKKIRGPRPGGKNNQQIGFFTEDEVRKLEAHKVEFCNMHGLSGDMTQFDSMVQHSERGGEPFPCPVNVCTKSQFWADIYALLPSRDRRSVYRFMRRHFQQSKQKAHDWTEEQDKELINLLETHGNKWAHIAKLLGRSDDDVTQRWKNRLEHRDKMNRGAWTEAELRGLLTAVEAAWQIRSLEGNNLAGKDIYGMDEKLVAWGAVSDSMNNTRSRQQCADKWRKVRKHILYLRATSDPQAEFDPVDSAKRSRRWSEKTITPTTTPKSQKIIIDDDDDDYNNDYGHAESTSHPAVSPKVGFMDFMKSLASRVAGGATTEPSPQPEPSSQPEPEIVEAKKADEIDKATESKKTKSSKERKHSEVEPPTGTAEPPSSLEKASTSKKEKAEKKQRKRERRERKERKRREREEAEAAAAAAAAKEAEEASAKKSKKEKNKKHRKSVAEANEDASVPASSPKKSKKSKRRKSTSEPNGAATAEPEKPASSKSKKSKKARKSEGVVDTAVNGTPTDKHPPQPQSDNESDESSDYEIKMEGSESD